MQVNYHTLAGFRGLNGEFLDELLTDNLAALPAAGVVKLKAVAQEGVRVRAWPEAGARAPLLLPRSPCSTQPRWRTIW